ncbi:ribonuclease P protein component [Candidatus Darwinibacter acetoxidans]
MERLKNPREFSFVYSKGTPSFGRYVVVSVVPTGKDVSRVGFAVSKKLGTAVTRNKVRRRLRAIVQELRNQFSPGYDVVVGAKLAPTALRFAELHEDLRCTLRKSRVWRKEAADLTGSGEEHA